MEKHLRLDFDFGKTVALKENTFRRLQKNLFTITNKISQSSKIYQGFQLFKKYFVYQIGYGTSIFKNFLCVQKLLMPKLS